MERRCICAFFALSWLQIREMENASNYFMVTQCCVCQTELAGGIEHCWASSSFVPSRKIQGVRRLSVELDSWKLHAGFFSVSLVHMFSSWGGTLQTLQTRTRFFYLVIARVFCVCCCNFVAWVPVASTSSFQQCTSKSTDLHGCACNIQLWSLRPNV